MRSHTHTPLDSLPQAQPVCMVQPKIQKTTNYIPPPIRQSTPASTSSIAPESSLELDTNHCDVIDETIKHVTHTHNQKFYDIKPM